jgi:hypothetical protein
MQESCQRPSLAWRNEQVFVKKGNKKRRSVERLRIERGRYRFLYYMDQIAYEIVAYLRDNDSGNLGLRGAILQICSRARITSDKNENGEEREESQNQLFQGILRNDIMSLAPVLGKDQANGGQNYVKREE